MIKDKKPEKIILDFTYVEDVEDIMSKMKANGILSVYHADAEKEFFISETITEEFLDGFGKSSLYITDDADKVTAAKKAGAAVLIYLHEANKAECFKGCCFYIEGFDDADSTYYTRVYQREKRIPWTIRETERLMIREMTPEDTEALYALYEDKSVVAYMEDLPDNREEEREYIKDYIDKVYGVFGFGMWLIVLKDTDEIIGRVGFQNYEEENQVELGFLIAPKYQRKGYAYEACLAALEYMQEEYEYLKIVVRCHRDNGGAIRLCNKLGLEPIIAD